MAKKKKNKETPPGSKGPNEELMNRLNTALSLEYAACIQYLQQQSLVKGQDRHDFAPFFASSSSEAHLHAQNLGNKIVSLGGVPTVVPAQVRQATELRDMLLNDLEMERTALEAYIRAWEAAENKLALRFWLEDIIRQEQLHVEELEKLTDRHRP
ncbi:MAG: ferritin-like domain-containing protein [Acidobacteria bacterium]|nr:ferritin-like domain-containing protein [Acidobacteriota bacterium]